MSGNSQFSLSVTANAKKNHKMTFFHLRGSHKNVLFCIIISRLRKNEKFLPSKHSEVGWMRSSVWMGWPINKDKEKCRKVRIKWVGERECDKNKSRCLCPFSFFPRLPSLPRLNGQRRQLLWKWQKEEKGVLVEPMVTIFFVT